jgi:hypothetical protein
LGQDVIELSLCAAPFGIPLKDLIKFFARVDVPFVKGVRNLLFFFLATIVL